MQGPLVSIILPTYNGNHIWLSQAIDSVISQTYTHRELIIINDASTNDIEKTILDFQKKDERIKYLKNERNMERSFSKNRGILDSRGKYIAFIDDDDIWCDNLKLEKQVKFMEINSEYGLCGTGVILIDEDGKEFDKILNRGGDENIRNTISGSNQFAHSSVIIRKNILIKNNLLFNENFYLAEDYDLWLKIGLVSKFDNLQEYSIKYRDRRSNTSNKNIFKLKLNAFRVYLQYRKNYPNQIAGIIKHLTAILMPKFVVIFLVEINKKIVNLLK